MIGFKRDNSISSSGLGIYPSRTIELKLDADTLRGDST